MCVISYMPSTHKFSLLSLLKFRRSHKTTWSTYLCSKVPTAFNKSAKLTHRYTPLDVCGLICSAFLLCLRNVADNVVCNSSVHEFYSVLKHSTEL